MVYYILQTSRGVKSAREKVKTSKEKSKHRRTQSQRSTKSSNKLHREILQLTEGTCNMLSCRLRSQRREGWTSSPEDINLTRGS